jgi:CBS domain-containing protein
MTRTSGGANQVKARAGFLARHELFAALSRGDLDRAAASVVERLVPAGEAVLVEGGRPGTQLYMVRDGIFELIHKDAVVAILASGEVFGHPTLLAGQAPELTVKARQDSVLYCIPKKVALDLLNRPEGVKFAVRNLRERLVQAARTMRALPEVRTRPVTSLVRSSPLFCDPDMTIRGAAEMMIAEGRSAILIKARDGLGIVTDVDLRDKVVVAGIPSDAPVATIMTTPVKTIGADALAPEAAVEMMAAGVNHVPVVDAGGRVVGILSASSLMTLDARSPFALRRSILGARTVGDVAEASADVPQLFVDLLDARVDAPALTRVLTLLSDSMTMRLVELSIERRGRPPVSYAWLALGSGARSELTLASDQDNGLAYADSDDPSVDEYFRLMALDVIGGLRRCGFPLDPHAVLAASRDWRMSLSEWEAVFTESLKGCDLDCLARASVAFDFRRVVGDLEVDPPLTDIIRQAPRHRRFMTGIAELGTKNPSPLGFLHRLPERIDIKRDALVPIQSMVRYWAFAKGITASTTLDRLVAVRDAGFLGAKSERSLREAFISMSHLQLRHHANAIRAGRPPDNDIDVAALRPLTRVVLQEALREADAAQKWFPRRRGVNGAGA